MVFKFFRALLGVGLSVALGACTTLGPDYQTPDVPQLPDQWSGEELADASAEAAQWWLLFNDPPLTSLVELGAAQNLSIEAAGLRIVQARAALGISDALIFPQRQQVSANAGKAYQSEQSFNSAGIGLDVGWEMDIWGKYARGIESSEAILYASIASYRDVMVTISAEIARNYINYRTAQERMSLSQQNIEIQKRVVAMTQVQFDAGNVSELDVQQAKTQLYATLSSLPQLNITRIQSLNAMAVLVGGIPQDIEPQLALSNIRSSTDYEQRLSAVNSGIYNERSIDDYGSSSLIPVAPHLNTNISSELLLRRPDLQVAELQARGQSARIGLRQADLYPQFFLFGSIGLSDTVRSGDSFSTSSAVTAAIGPGMSWNIFQYGRIKNQVRIEDALFQESLTNYNRQVLEAVQEVGNAAAAYEYSVEKSVHDLGAVQSSIRAFNISANQYNNGLVTYQRLLSTVEKMTVREDVYAQTRGNIAIQLVALYKALGGGWQSHTTLPLVKPSTRERMEKRTDWGNYLQPGVLSGDDRDE